MAEPITRFSGQYFFLSNFYPCPITVLPVLYPTVEHAFQAQKTLDPRQREQIRLAPTPGEAKRLGRRVTLRPGWDDARIEVMKQLIRQKFFRYPELGRRLVDTGQRELIEGNTWGDRFWGQVEGVGENHLGHILMKIRAELRAGIQPDDPFIHIRWHI